MGRVSDTGRLPRAQPRSAHLASRRRYRYAVGFGVALSCARFAWQSASHIAVRHYYRAARRGEAGSRVKVYEVDGPLFFASAMPFIKQARDHRSHPWRVSRQHALRVSTSRRSLRRTRRARGGYPPKRRAQT